MSHRENIAGTVAEPKAHPSCKYFFLSLLLFDNSTVLLYQENTCWQVHVGILVKKCC